MNYTEAITSTKTSNALQFDAVTVLKLKTEMLHITTDDFVYSY